MPPQTDSPLILFGAFDRHNFGDLLLAHVAAARAAARFPGRPLVYAGVADRDMRPWGGHGVRAIADLAREWEDRWGERPADVWHVGGEVLTCSVYEATVMTLTPAQATAAIARYDAHPEERLSWAQKQLGLTRQVAYLAPRSLFRNPGRFTCRAVGGVELSNLPMPMRAELRAALAQMDTVSVRDRVTLDQLAAWDIHAELEADPGEQVADLFAPLIARHAAAGAPAAVRARFPRGYLAFQFSADFGDDATLQALAAQLDQTVCETGLGLCLFRAGAAPWHDDEAVYRRLMGFMGTRQTLLFDSLHLWDICALLSRAVAYCGSSLHGRMVAGAFGVPGVSLAREASACGGKVKAYWETWHGHEPMPVSPEGVHQALRAHLVQ